MQSNASNISCVIENNWFTQESEGRKPGCLRFYSVSSKMKLHVLLKITFSEILPKMGKREIIR